MQTEKKVWDWRTHILKDGPDNSVYKHVLLTLSCYMNSAGGSCFPAISTLVDDTSLSKPTVVKYLGKAREDGWIQVSKHGFGGQKWARNEYKADLPKAVKEVNSPKEKVVKEVNQGGKTDREGSKADDERRLSSLPTNSSYNTSSNSSINSSQISSDTCEEIFNFYPRKVKKEVALVEIKKALKNLTEEGVDNPAKFLLKKVKLFAEAKEDTNPKYIQFPENWFSQNRYYEHPDVWMPDDRKKRENENSAFESDCEFNLQKIRGEHLTNFKDRDMINNPQVSSDIYDELQENLDKNYV